jgi:SAM-dependent methyltransferase
MSENPPHLAQTNKADKAFSLRRVVRFLPFLNRLEHNLNNQFARDDFVIKELASLPAGSLLLDAGCGSQRYKRHCNHLEYRAQDFGKYKTDSKKMLGYENVEDNADYQYGTLDYVGDVWNIEEKPETFDAILCTEVFEHILFPNETVKEFSRLLKPGGKMILTAPSNCLRHMDPYFFYTGFSDRWFESILKGSGFEIKVIKPVGDYYSWLSVEIARTAHTQSLFAKLLLFSAFLYYYNKKKTNVSVDALCMGYHVVAEKKYF